MLFLRRFAVNGAQPICNAEGERVNCVLSINCMSNVLRVIQVVWELCGSWENPLVTGVILDGPPNLKIETDVH